MLHDVVWKPMYVGGGLRGGYDYHLVYFLCHLTFADDSGSTML